MRRKIFYDLFFSFLQPHQTVVVFIGEENSMSVSKANKHVNKIDFSFDFYELFFLWQSIVECVRVCGGESYAEEEEKSHIKIFYMFNLVCGILVYSQKCVFIFRHRFNSILAREKNQ